MRPTQAQTVLAAAILRHLHAVTLMVARPALTATPGYNDGLTTTPTPSGELGEGQDGPHPG